MQDQDTRSTKNYRRNRLDFNGRCAVVGKSVFDLVETEIGGALSYMTTGGDPQMILADLESGQTFSCDAGHYKFFFQARVTQGRIYRPRLYIDCGDGFSETHDHNIFLQSSGSDVWVGDIFTSKPIAQIRFDPSESKVRFTLLRMEIESWGHDCLKPIQAVYQTFRATYNYLPTTIRNSRRIGQFAKYVANSIFKRQRHALHEQRMAISIYTEESDIRDGAGYNQTASILPDLYSRHYFEELSVAHSGRDPAFAPVIAKQAEVAPGDPRTLAFYLPQFHPFPENDSWWGRGFTEWTNVSKAVPQFSGHYQPRLPGELGYYDLRLPDVLARQIALAKLFGLSGFCFHYYWFAGKRLLERPIEALLAAKGSEFDFPFCLCWANENWTRRWDGAEHDVLMKQDHTREDHENVFMDLFRYMSDKRYICVDGKPVILVYRPSSIPEVKEMVEIWRALALKMGLRGLYLVATTAFGFSDPASIGFDALCQFPPHAVSVGNLDAQLDMLNPNFSGNVYDYKETVDAYVEILNEVALEPQTTAFFPGVMAGWDNEARKPGRGHIFHNATPGVFHDWLTKALDWSSNNNPPTEQFVFINAWNEWAEGTYLEPDRRYGYAYLHAVAAARAERLPAPKALLAISNELQGNRSCNTVVCLHIFYEDLIDEFAVVLDQAREIAPLDVIVSVPSTWNSTALDRLVKKLNPVRIVVTQNRGRDVWPFIQTLRVAKSLGYEFGCKIHSKKSTHLSSGDHWRQGLVKSLLSPAARVAAMDVLGKGAKVGLVAPNESFFEASNANSMRDNRANILALLGRFATLDTALVDFVAGTMFWFRCAAFDKLMESDIAIADFGAELGAIDGTIAHAFERIFPTLVTAAGYSVGQYSAPGSKPPY